MLTLLWCSRLRGLHIHSCAFRVLHKYVVEFLRFGCGAVEVLGYHFLSQDDWYPSFRLVFKGSGVLGRFDPVTCGSSSPRLLRLLFGERL